MLVVCSQIPLWAELEEEKNLDMKEFAGLFSRQVTASRKPVKRTDEATRPSKVQPAKILDSKRSKTVGILEKSLRVDFCEVENAVYNLDTSVINLEALQQIYEIVGIDVNSLRSSFLTASLKRLHARINRVKFLYFNILSFLRIKKVCIVVIFFRSIIIYRSARYFINKFIGKK